MQLSNILLSVALITGTTLAAPTPTTTLENRSGLEKRTTDFFFPGDGSIIAGQPKNFSAAKYPVFCYVASKDIKLYFTNPAQKCGSIPVQQTPPGATVA